MSTAAAYVVPTACPECGGGLWDNRADNAKKNDGKRRPDFRCKENREHVIWPPSEKKGAAPRSAAAPRQAYSAGPHIPAMDGPRPIVTPEYGDVPAQQAAVDRVQKLDAMFSLYGVCYAQAFQTVSKAFPGETPSPVAVTAAAATLFIAAKERGLAA